MRVAAIQAASIYLDTPKTLAKVLSLMDEAAKGGADLCAFPETFLSGYPIWPDITDGAQFDDAKQKSAYAAYVASAVDGDGPELKQVAEHAAKLDLFVYLGLVERARSGGSVYCSLAAIHPERGIVSMHRKLMPTHAERMVWSQGDAHGLRVHDWKGFRVGGLNCWENWMPLARYTLYSQGEQLHIATWPGAPYLTRDISRFVAMEGRLYVMSVGGVLNAKDIPDSFPLKAEVVAVRERFLTGGTMIVGPDGEIIEGPAKDDETILYADLELSTVLGQRQNFDPAGHYSRPDVFSLEVDQSRRPPK